MTEQEKNAESERVAKGLEELTLKYLPSDMDVERVIARTDMVGIFVGTTRTGVVASMLFAAMYHKVVGLETETMVKLLKDVDNLMKDSAYVAELQQKYAEMNLKAKSKTAFNTELGSTISEAIMVPGNDKVH